MSSKVECTTDGKRIMVRFPYNKAYVEKIHKVPGSRYHAATTEWWCPLALSSATTLRREFGERLVILPPLWKWATAERAREAGLEALRDPDAPVRLERLAEVSPLLYGAVGTRPYQGTGISFIRDARNVLLADQPGLGKTYQALAAIVEAGSKRVLVAAPRTALRSVWANKILELFPDDAIAGYVAQGSRAERQAVIQQYLEDDLPSVLIINLEMIRVLRMWRCRINDDPWEEDWPEYKVRPGRKGGCYKDHDHRTRFYPEYPELFDTVWDAIILDESHHALASTKNRNSADITQIRLGAVRLKVAENGIRLAASGTPFRSKPEKAWGTLNWLRPDVFTSYWRFANELFETSPGWGGSSIVGAVKDPNAFQSALRPYYLAREKADVAKDLPPIQYAGTPPPSDPDGPIGVYLDMEPEQDRAYHEMAKMASARIRDGQVNANGVLAELTRARQFACSYLAETDNRREGKKIYVPSLPSNKLEWTLQFLSERAGHPGKVVIATNFTSLIGLLTEQIVGLYPAQFRTLTGATTDQGRALFVKDFQDPKSGMWIGIINMKAGGEAITLDAADDMIILDEPWTSDELQQVEDRIHRVSRIHQVTVYRLRSTDTVDERIASLTDAQRRTLMSIKPSARKLAISLFE